MSKPDKDRLDAQQQSAGAQEPASTTDTAAAGGSRASDDASRLQSQAGHASGGTGNATLSGLISGGYRSRNEVVWLYTDLDSDELQAVSFRDPELDGLRRQVVAGVRSAAASRAQAPGANAGNAAANAKVGMPDAERVASLPAWFNELQDYLNDCERWDELEQAGQELLRLYLSGSDPQAPSNVRVFYEHVGKSERNQHADDLVNVLPVSDRSKMNDKASGLWCAQATSEAASLGPALEFRTQLEAAGYRFIPPTPTPHGWTPDMAARTLMERHGPTLLRPRDTAAPKPDAAGGAEMGPGDMFSLLSSSSTTYTTTTGSSGSGHKATCVSVRDTSRGKIVRYVSGNAGSPTNVAGNGTIRVDEAIWVPRPATGAPNADKPARPGEIYVWGIQKYTPQTRDANTAPLDQARQKNPKTLESTYHLRYDPNLDTRSNAGAAAA